jgi:hypothetical protein
MPTVDGTQLYRDAIDKMKRMEKSLLFIRQWFKNLEDGTDDDDPLKAIRLRFHAPVHQAIDEALKP